MTNIFFNGTWRMDWGLGNPNTTAALIATLMVGIWILAYLKPWGFWIALTGFVGLGICLVHTFSRGGMAALLVGCLPLLAFLKMPWSRTRLIAVVIGFWAIIGAAFFFEAHLRYGQGIASEDRSISNRLLIWNAVPQMIVDSPNGWGIGNAANAFVQWYQPIDRGETYLHLVNSHLTWLVEFGWLLRVLYIFGWLAVFLICLPSWQNRWLSVPFGVWLAFFTASIFSAVAESIWLWILPAVLLSAVVAYRTTKRRWFPWTWVLVPAGMTILLCLSVFGLATGSSIASGSSTQVVFGKPSPTYVALYDKTTMGTLYGKTLRQNSDHLSDSGISLVFDSKFMPDDLKGKTLVLGAELPSGGEEKLLKTAQTADALILLSPRYFPEQLPIASPNVTVSFGDFSQSPAIQSWMQVAQVRQKSGMGDFFPDWPKMLTEDLNQP